jgi:hypothetical protein
MSAIEPMISLPTTTYGGCRDRRRCHEEDRWYVARQEERDLGLNATGLGREAHSDSRLGGCDRHRSPRAENTDRHGLTQAVIPEAAIGHHPHKTVR